MAVICDPASLTKAATCFLCIPKREKKVCNLFALATTTLPGKTPSQIAVGAAQFRPFLGEDYLSLKAYFLAKIAGLGNSVSGLMLAAKCWQCIPRSEREDVETYLYAQMAGISTSAAIEKAAAVFRPSVESYQQMELYLLFLKSGDGTLSVSMNGAKCFRCLNPGHLVELNLYLLCQAINSGAMSGIATPTGFTFLPSDTSGNTIVASWNAPPSGVTATEVWTSTDNVHFILNQTVAAPGTTTTPGFIQGNPIWCQIRWVTATAQSQFTPSILIPAQVPVWLKAVVTNGGAQVSLNTALAVNTFALALVSAGIDTMMISALVVAPDNLTAALTPLYKTAGNDPWTNGGANIVAGDLSVNGLTGNAGNKVLGTGVISTNVFQNTAGAAVAGTTCGLSVYAFTVGTVASGFDMGAASNNPSGEMSISSLFTPTSANQTAFDAFNNSTGHLAFVNAGWKGFSSGNRTSGTAIALYIASSTQAFTLVASNNNTVIGNAMPAVQFAGLGYNSAANALTGNTNRTLSFMGIHLGLTSTQAQALFNAVQALQTAFGGGFV